MVRCLHNNHILLMHCCLHSYRILSSTDLANYHFIIDYSTPLLIPVVNVVIPPIYN